MSGGQSEDKMEAKVPKDAVRRMLETLYEQRAERLRPLKLDDILPSTSSIFWSPDHQSSVEIVRKLIRDEDFCLKAIQAKGDITTPQFSYDEELAKASNRITLEFINKYCALDYSIDWEKLVQFNSGKD